MSIQIGTVAYRDPKTGEFLEAKPIFEERTDINERAYDTMIRNAGRMMGHWLADARDNM